LEPYVQVRFPDVVWELIADGDDDEPGQTLDEIYSIKVCSNFGRFSTSQLLTTLQPLCESAAHPATVEELGILNLATLFVVALGFVLLTSHICH
jgi:hypothetical protein